MVRPKVGKPTERELEIMQVIWVLGPSSVRAVREELNRERKQKIAYNSVLTVMTIMQTKGLLKRDVSDRTHIYDTSYSQEEIEQRLVQLLITEVFGGSAARLVSRALSAEVTSAEDAAAIEKLLETLDERA